MQNADNVSEISREDISELSDNSFDHSEIVNMFWIFIFDLIYFYKQKTQTKNKWIH